MKIDATVQPILLSADTKTPRHIEESGEHSRIEMTVSHGVRATVFDTSTSDIHELHVNLEPESELHIVSLSSRSARKFSSELADGAKVFWHCFTFGSTVLPHTLVSTIRGRNATSDIDWVFSVHGEERQAVDVRNVFEGEDGGGEITMKGVAEGRAFATCNGMIEITEGGRGTNTYLTEDVLMLDATAKIDAIPALEIRTNDVKASHSATVSRVTVEDLFYFQSRGIDEKTSRRMFTEGFLSSLFERVPCEQIRERLVQAVSSISE